ncbi:MAG: hypothetical protein ACI841_000549 [Planctomycetota bacterium]|jgi:hypothetical protein
MSDAKRLNDDLDRIATRAGESLSGVEARIAFAQRLRLSLPFLAAIPAYYVVLQLIHWNTGGDPQLLPLPLIAGLAVAVPVALAWLASRSARQRDVPRLRAVGEADRQLGLEGRLLAADEFMRRETRTSFEQAAIDDAAERTAQAAAAALQQRDVPIKLGRAASGWAGVAVAGLLVAIWVGTFDLKAVAAQGGDALVAAAGTSVDLATEPVREDAPEPAIDDADAKAETEARKAAREAKSKPADTATEVNDDVKESSGKTGSGRSAGALSSSAASESKSSPSSQGQQSDPSKRDPKIKKPNTKKPKETQAQPEPEERPEDEQSGATAGKGSSKGSNKNPTASDWKSRDQVTDVDDQEVEDDEDTDEDEEEQENRGGVQPSLRDRRPPVSRDLQIGFGNRPNPDANGRGGPSEQKKSRGVASLVLGVPIPDRIKGRPGPGPTKITQERIEPEAEQAAPIGATARMARDTPLERPTPVSLDPALRNLVRDYFLRMRAEP